MEDKRLIRRFPAGEVTPPSSKSLGHRAVICAALAARQGSGCCRVDNITLSQDIAVTIGGMEALGCRLRLEGNTLHTEGAGEMGRAPIDCGESGSTLRFFVPLAAALNRGETVFHGRGRLMDRPMDAYVDAGISLEKRDGALAVRGPLKGGRYRLAGDVSSQFLTGLLLALPLTGTDSEITLSTHLESGAYVDLTLDMMERFGVRVERPDDRTYRIPGGQAYQPCDYRVEADFSAASYILAAAALGRDVRCRGLNPHSLQGDRAMLDVLRQMGAEVTVADGCAEVKAGRLKAATVDVREIPDLVPTIAALMAVADGTSRIVNAGRLRHKESDRLASVTSELNKLGARVTEGPDSLIIQGVERLKGGAADAWNDHRIAMAVAVAAIACEGPVELTGASSVQKSYPGFWEDFEKEERHGKHMG